MRPKVIFNSPRNITEENSNVTQFTYQEFRENKSEHEFHLEPA